jgi:hypothetical protein
MALDSRLPRSWCRRVGSPKTGTSWPGLQEMVTPAVVAEVWHGVHRLFGQTAQVELGEGDPQPVRHRRVGQQVLGHPLQLLRVAIDGLQHAHLLLGEFG